jgi:hydrogenase-4 transcriptional activator
MTSHAHELVSMGDFRRAAEWLNSRISLSQSDRILKAHLELELGDSAAAQLLADALLKEHLGKSARALCLDISGRALARSGSTAQGLSLLQKSIAIAAECDPQLHAELLGHYAKALLSWAGTESALAVLPQLRKAALRAGNRRALVEYHLSVARVSAMRDCWRRAKAELDVAKDLLDVEPRLDQLWQLRQVQAAIAIKVCQLTTARIQAQEALGIATMIGSVPFQASSLANLAHITAISGNYQEARQYIDQALPLLAPLSHVRFALYATQVDVGLWSLDTNYASRAIEAGEQLSHEFAGRGFYYRFWFELHHARWLVRQGHNVEAASLAVNALTDVETLADAKLLFRMRMLAAEATAKNKSIDAGISVANFSTLVASDLSVEDLAEMSRLASVLTHERDAATAVSYLGRAARLLTASGLIGPLADVDRTKADVEAAGTTISTGFRHDPISALESAALMLSLGNHPRALGAEAQFLLSSFELCEQIELKESRSEKTGVGAGPRDADNHVIELGSQDGKTYTLTFRSRAPKRPAAILAVQQIIRAALSATTLPAAEDQVALWPQETIASELGLIVSTESMRELLSTSRKLAPSNIPVLITGETGTGKELLAKGLHEASPRRARDFIPFNCTAVARDMLDAQLFGYRRGAFTGAHEAFQGVIRAAAGGTLFLDEIGEIGLDVQPKLLRFLESGEIHPLGEPKPIVVDVRVVAATNANLEQLVAEGRFREDLLYRLNVVRLQVPPLRERREEIPPLVQHYLERCIQESRKTGLRFAEETMEYLVLYRWPGNVRQLANEVRRLVALAEPGAVLMPEHLSHDIRASRRTLPVGERTLTPTEVVVRTDQPLPAAMEHLERTMVQQALRESSGRLEDAAQRLGLSRKGLYLKRLRLGITDQPGAVSDATSGARADVSQTAKLKR